MGLHVAIWIFDGFPFFRLAFSLFAIVWHYRLLENFPRIEMIPAIISGALLLFNHFFWFEFFLRRQFLMLEIAMFYIVMVWMVPVGILICFSASEFLPSFSMTC